MRGKVGLYNRTKHIPEYKTPSPRRLLLWGWPFEREVSEFIIYIYTYPRLPLGIFRSRKSPYCVNANPIKFEPSKLKSSTQIHNVHSRLGIWLHKSLPDLPGLGFSAFWSSSSSSSAPRRSFRHAFFFFFSFWNGWLVDGIPAVYGYPLTTSSHELEASSTDKGKTPDALSKGGKGMDIRCSGPIRGPQSRFH